MKFRDVYDNLKSRPLPIPHSPRNAGVPVSTLAPTQITAGGDKAGAGAGAAAWTVKV